MRPEDVERAHHANIAAWNRNATFWDERMAEGNDFARLLVLPPTDELLAIRPNETVLDVACGNGLYARRMAAAGARVVAIDYAQEMLGRARAHGCPEPGSIDYELVDATNKPALMRLGERRFDAAVCCMALMDMARVRPLFRALRELLKPDGRFVFSVLHPCFNHSRASRMAELDERDANLEIRYAVKVSGYLEPTLEHGVAIPGQPAQQTYFERPLHELLTPAFEAGLVLDGVRETAFPPGTETGATALSWNGAFSLIPAVLVARLRPRLR